MCRLFRRRRHRFQAAAGRNELGQTRQIRRYRHRAGGVVPVLEAIDALPTEFREVLALSDIEGMSYGEIAATLKIPVGTVKSRLFRARRQLQAVLYNHAIEMGYIKPRETAP